MLLAPGASAGVMGGSITAAGLLTILAVMNTSAMREKQTLIFLALTGLFTVGTMSLTNLQLNSDFKWLLMIPALLWALGLAFPTVLLRSDN